MACRIILQLPKHSSVNTYLVQLHWLKIQHITFKVATIMYKCVNSIAPVYLTEMVLSELPHNRNLRSTQRRLLYKSKPNQELNLCIVVHSNQWGHAYGTLYQIVSRIVITLMSSNLILRHIYLVYHTTKLHFLFLNYY